MRLLIPHIALCLILSVAACRGRDSAPVEPQAATGAPADIARMEDACPVHVPATTVTVVNNQGGVVMFFTTTPSNVAEVRRRVAALAKMETEHAVSGHGASDVEMPWVFGAQPVLVPLTAKVEDISDGASLVLAPVDPANVEQLRAYTRSRARSMQLGRCSGDFAKPRTSQGPQSAVVPPNGTLG